MEKIKPNGTPRLCKYCREPIAWNFADMLPYELDEKTKHDCINRGRVYKDRAYGISQMVRNNRAK